jgi:polyphenol oxidase
MAYFKEIYKILTLQFELLDRFPEVVQFSTTRIYGEDKNFSMSYYANQKDILKNATPKEILAESFEIAPSHFVFCRQTHSDNISVINSVKDDNGFYDKNNAIVDTDGLITSSKNICLVAQTADCVPVLLYDPIKHIAAAIHSGWRGTAKQILKKAINKMQNEFMCEAGDIICCIGPSAGPCCYEVGEDVQSAFSGEFINPDEFFIPLSKGKYRADLWKANKSLALSCGIPELNIETSEVCTICNSDMFYSARVHKENTGRMATGIMMV